MNWFQFIASIVSSLAWPLVVLGVVAVLREPLSRLLRSLHHLAVQGVEIDFGQQLASIEREADQAKALDAAVQPNLADDSSTPQETTNEANKEAKWDIDDEVRALAAQSPTSAVIRAWVEIERTLNETIARLGRSPEGRRSPVRVMNVLHQSGYIDDETYSILRRLSMLRNQVLHPQDTVTVTYAEALEYAQLANRMAQRLNAIDLR